MKKEGEAGLVECSNSMFIHRSKYAKHSCVSVCVCVRVVVVRTFDVRDVFGPEMYGNVSFEVPLAMLAEEHMVCYMP